MKKWTVVVEITDNSDEPGFTKEEIQSIFTPGDYSDCPDVISFQFMECIEAPYGPQHPNGVFLDERHMPKGRRP